MNHRIGRILFALLVGVLVTVFSYQWITDPVGREERAIQLSVVESSREHLNTVVGAEALEIVDPLAPNRKVGKVYIYPEGDAWSVSGHYRRDSSDPWHPYLMILRRDHSMRSLKLQDNDQLLVERSGSDPSLEVSP